MSEVSAGAQLPPALPPIIATRWKGVLFAGIWLVYLGYPVEAAWQSPRPVWRVVALVAIAVFATLFLVFCASIRVLRQAPAADPQVWGCLAAMICLLVLIAPAAGVQALGSTIYIGVLAVMALPARAGLAVVGVLVVCAEVLPGVVPGWELDQFFALQLVASCVAAWGVTQVIERSVQLAAAREEIARLAVADERLRMSRDLHDVLGHSLTVITVKAELAGRLAESEGASRAVAEIAQVERLAREALADVRTTVGGTRQVSLASELVSARSALVAAGITPDLPQAVDEVPAGRRQLFGWVVREGVTNVVRHSGARTCHVRFGADWVEVTDDGAGPTCDPGDPTVSGHGLAGLRERVAHELGVLHAGVAGLDGGFRLRVDVPA